MLSSRLTFPTKDAAETARMGHEIQQLIESGNNVTLAEGYRPNSLKMLG